MHSQYALSEPIPSSRKTRKLTACRFIQTSITKLINTLIKINYSLSTFRRCQDSRPTHNSFPNICLLMNNDKQRIRYVNYVCFMFIVLINISSKVLTLSFIEPDIFILQANIPTTVLLTAQWQTIKCRFRVWKTNLMNNDKQRIRYVNYVCFMFIVLMTNFHELKDKHL
jgi:hypothetical protein